MIKGPSSKFKNDENMHQNRRITARIIAEDLGLNVVHIILTKNSGMKKLWAKIVTNLATADRNKTGLKFT